MKKFFISSLILLFSSSAHALMPLESLLLGDFSEEYYDLMESIDPLNYIFQDVPLGSSKDRYNLAIYRAIIFEGVNLKNECDRTKKISYSSTWKEEQAKRSYLSTLQYIGLDVTTRAIAKYSLSNDYSKDEYYNLVDNLVGNYCSKNISIISKKQLVKNMKALYHNDAAGFKLPSVKGNKLFSESLQTVAIIDDARKREFIETIRLFKSFCSWGGSVSDLRLMVPLVKDPVVGGIVSRSMAGMKLTYDSLNKSTYRERSKDNRGVVINCTNLICRRTTHEDALKKMPRSMGYKSFEDDQRRLFCSHFLKAKYNKSTKVKPILDTIKKTTPEDDIKLVSQFLALLTGVPDFLIGLDKYEDLELVFRSSLDDVWNDWAQERNKKFSKDLYFEEQLMIEKVDRELYFDYKKAKFGVVFDINLGEYDRINQIIGKVGAEFNVKIPHSVLALERKNWARHDLNKKEVNDRSIEQLKNYIDPVTKKINDNFMQPLWKGDLGRLIAIEILDQIVQYQGNYFKFSKRENVDIKIVFNFAPFALKYQNYKYRILIQKKRQEARDKSLIQGE